MVILTPYYDHNGITIYHGDCLEIMPHLEPVDLVLTDPPYGINVGKQAWFSHQKNRKSIYGDDKPFDPRPILNLSIFSILWGANHYADKLPPSPCWLVWNKIDGMKRGVISDCELAWTNLNGPIRLFSHQWIGYLKASERGFRVHPTQKPKALMKWCLQFANGTILDPFMGSGTTLVAAKELGRKAIGIEIEEKYCQIAVRRLAQEAFQWNSPSV